MKKPILLVSSPFDSYSGYGSRSRDVIRAILNSDKYDVKLLSQPWGSTPIGFCENNAEFFDLLYYKVDKIEFQPDIFIQITIPEEFIPYGRYNIGITAGIETDKCNPMWGEGMEKMDLILTSSNHSKKVLEETLTSTPIKVLFEGFNPEVIRYTNDIFVDLKNIKENHVFLFVGHWMAGEFGHDRKNVSLLIKAFFEVFKNKPKKPALLLKTSIGSSSYLSREEILKRIDQIRKTVDSNNLPNIYLLHGDISDYNMNLLYNHPKVKTMVSLTKGEGFGRPLLEFSIIGKPIITTKFSGHLDFLSEEYCTLIDGELENVHPSVANKWLREDSKWFKPNNGEIGNALIENYEFYNKKLEKSQTLSKLNKQNFSLSKMGDILIQEIEKGFSTIPQEIELNLPKL